MKNKGKIKIIFSVISLALLLIVLVMSLLASYFKESETVNELKYTFADPINLTIKGLSVSELKEIKIYRLAPSGEVLEVKYTINHGKSSIDKVPPAYYHELLFSTTENILNEIEGIDVFIGDKIFSFNKKEFIQKWVKVENELIDKENKEKNDQIVILKAPIEIKKYSILNRLFFWDNEISQIINFNFNIKSFFAVLSIDEARLISISYFFPVSLIFSIILFFIILILVINKFYTKKNFFSDYLSCNIAIFSIFFIGSSFFIITGYGPVHDAIGWQGIFHYFSENAQQGILPLWNPYSQTGTPFYVYYQTIGLLNPTYFISILIQKITQCTSVTAYIINYMLTYFIFILGTYYLLRQITNNNKSNFWFSIVLFLSTWHTFLRQNGALNLVFLIPFITYFLIKFFKEEEHHHKRLFLLIFCYLTAISLNIYIPTGVILYLIIFVFISIVLLRRNIKNQLRFFANKTELIWLGISVLVFILIITPIAAMYFSYEELFPAIRFLQKNGNNLPKLFISDMKGNILSSGFSDSQVVSVTLGNILGTIFEPIKFENIFYSEIKLYTGVLPIFFVSIAMIKIRTRKVLLFLIISLATFFVMTGFNNMIVAKKSINQIIMSNIFPFLKTSEVLQNFGSIFILTIILLASIGFEEIRINYKLRILSFFILGVIAFKYSLLIVKNNYFYGSLGLFLLLIISIIIIRTIKKKKIDRMIEVFKSGDSVFFTNLLLAIIIIELFLFNFFIPTSTVYGSFISKDLTKFLGRVGIYEPAPENKDFLLYREVTPFKSDSELETLFGLEVYKPVKAAFPVSIAAKLVNIDLPLWDSFYMTKYYYDYALNISIEKQLLTSGITAPIIRFFPSGNVIFTDDKYDTAVKINLSSDEQLNNNIFIEKDIDKHNRTLSVEDLFDQDNYLNFTIFEKNKFNKKAKEKTNIQPDFFKILSHNANMLSIETNTSEDGYLYYSDGYSKYWKGYIDNNEVKIEKANINFKAVFLPEGSHTVKFIYDPAIYKYSLILYAAGNLIFIYALAVTLFSLRLFIKRTKRNQDEG